MSYQLHDRKAYIVDDDQEIRNIVRRVLTARGVYTEEYVSGESFLDELENRDLGCVILDLRLPGIDGLEVLRRIKSEPVSSPVVMLSGHGDIELAIGAVKLGAIDFLEKPFQKSKLNKMVDSAFGIIDCMRVSGAEKIRSLTRREKDVLISFSDGAANKVVAQRLNISVRTVEMHRINIIAKLGVGNLTQALLLARDCEANSFLEVKNVEEL